MDEAGDHPARAEVGGPAGYLAEKGEGQPAVTVSDDPQLRHVLGHDVLEEAPHSRSVTFVRKALEGPETKVRVAEAYQHRRSGRGGFVAPLEFLACLEQAERLGGVYAERLEHRRGEHLAYAALERELAIPPARPRRRPAPLRAEIQDPPGFRAGVEHLREEKSATVAERRVVHAELVAVVAQGKRLVEVAQEGLEAREVTLPLVVGEGVEPDAGRPGLVAVTEPSLRKACRRHHVVEALPEARDARHGAVAGSERHGCAKRLRGGRGASRRATWRRCPSAAPQSSRSRAAHRQAARPRSVRGAC